MKQGRWLPLAAASESVRGNHPRSARRCGRTVAPPSGVSAAVGKSSGVSPCAASSGVFSFSSCTRAAEAAAGSVIEAFHRHQFRLVHLSHHAELADAVAARDRRVAHGQRWKAPHVVIAAVAFVDDTHAVRLQNSPLAEGRAARHNVRLVPLRQLHRHAQRNNAELPRVLRGFCSFLSLIFDGKPSVLAFLRGADKLRQVTELHLNASV